MRVLVAAALLLALGCSREGGQKSGSSPAGRRPDLRYPVDVARTERRTVAYTLTAVGSVEAFERVQITARVAGVVERVRFEEGQTVRQGETLAEIEPARFLVAVRSASAALSKAEASLAEAEAGVQRRDRAVTESPGLIPQEELVSWRTRVRVAAADVAEKEALADAAALNLADAYVRAPIGGSIETRSVQTGQYVQPGTILGTLLQRDPLRVRLHVPEQDAGHLGQGMRIEIRGRGQNRAHSARITHVSQAADPTSRMVSVLGEIEGSETGELRPGAFAEAAIPLGDARDAIVVPESAIRPSEKGFLAFVVEDGVAKERVLSLGMRTHRGGIEVKAGLSAGELLVVRGGEALRDGASVIVPTPGSAEPTGSGTVESSSGAVGGGG